MNVSSTWNGLRFGDVVEYSASNFTNADDIIYTGKIREVYSNYIAIETQTPKRCRITVYKGSEKHVRKKEI